MVETRIVAVLALSLSLGSAGCRRTNAPMAPPALPGGAPDAEPAGVPAGVLSCDSVVDDPPGEPWPIVTTEFLALAPADTPYVFANLEPLPAALLDRLEPFAAPMGEAFNKGYAKASGGQAGDRALRDLLGDTLTMESARRAGIELNTTFVVYGLGLAPVARVRLGDSARFLNVVEQVEKAETTPSRTADFHGQKYWYRPQDDGALAVFAVVGPDLVFAYLPAGSIQRELLPLVFGQRVPEQSLATTRRLDALRSAHGLTPHFLSVVDVEVVARTLLGRSPPGLEQQVAEAMHLVKPQSPACTEDFVRLAHAFPQVVFGFESLSATRVVMSATVATHPAIAEALAGTVGPIPGRKSDSRQEAVMSAGVGIDMDGVRTAVHQFATAMERDPFSCEALRFISDGGPKLAAALTMLPPAVDHIEGASMVFRTITKGAGKTELDGFALVGTDDPRAVIDALAALAPEVRLDRLTRPKQPVPATELFPGKAKTDPMLAASHVAYSKRAIGWAWGTKGKRDLLRALDSRGTDDGTVLVGIFDMPRALQQMPELLEKMRASTPDPIEAKLLEAVLGVIGRVTYRLAFSERGPEFEYEMTVPPAK